MSSREIWGAEGLLLPLVSRDPMSSESEVTQWAQVYRGLLSGTLPRVDTSFWGGSAWSFPESQALQGGLSTSRAEMGLIVQSPRPLLSAQTSAASWSHRVATRGRALLEEVSGGRGCKEGLLSWADQGKEGASLGGQSHRGFSVYFTF
jgi:hypothetical protein